MLFLDSIKKEKDFFNLSSKSTEDHRESSVNPLYLSYIVSFIQLCAELCKVDDPVNLAEIEYFCSLFPQSSSNRKEMEVLFIEACNIKNDPLIAAIKIHSLFSSDDSLHKQTITALIKLALCDNYLNLKEKALLQSITKTFMLNEVWLTLQIKASIAANKINFNELIEGSKLNQENLNKYFKKLIKQYHPDKFIYLPNIAPEYIDFITDYFQEINSAYKIFKLKYRL